MKKVIAQDWAKNNRDLKNKSMRTWRKKNPKKVALGWKERTRKFKANRRKRRLLPPTTSR